MGCNNFSSTRWSKSPSPGVLEEHFMDRSTKRLQCGNAQLCVCLQCNRAAAGCYGIWTAPCSSQARASLACSSVRHHLYTLHQTLVYRIGCSTLFIFMSLPLHVTPYTLCTREVPPPPPHPPPLLLLLHHLFPPRIGHIPSIYPVLAFFDTGSTAPSAPSVLAPACSSPNQSEDRARVFANMLVTLT